VDTVAAESGAVCLPSGYRVQDEKEPFVCRSGGAGSPCSQRLGGSSPRLWTSTGLYQALTLQVTLAPGGE
jgi:hypothetical protein